MLEPGETYVDTLKRALLEKVGAKLVKFTKMGVMHSEAIDAEPYRPHLPWPEADRVNGY